MKMIELRSCWRITYKNGVVQMSSGHRRRAIHHLIPPNSITLDVMDRRQQVVNVTTKHAEWYEPFLLDDSFYWMDLTEHPQIVAQPRQGLYTDLAITTGLTLWGKAANHWVQRGYCYDAFKQQRCSALTEEYYESWWVTRQDGIPHHVFTSLARTEHHHMRALKRDLAMFKLRAKDVALRMMP